MEGVSVMVGVGDLVGVWVMVEVLVEVGVSVVVAVGFWVAVGVMVRVGVAEGVLVTSRVEEAVAEVQAESNKTNTINKLSWIVMPFMGIIPGMINGRGRKVNPNKFWLASDME
jgi:hypothetical protein